MIRRACLLWILAFSVAMASGSEPKRLLLIGSGPDNHPSGTHEYMAGLTVLGELLATNPQVRVEIVKADEPWTEGPERIAKADGAVVFLSEGARWLSAEPRRADAFARLAARGGGLSVLHWGMGTREAKPIQAFLNLFGGCHGGPDRKYQVLDAQLNFDPQHPATGGLKPARIHDEFYYKLKFVKDPEVQPLARVEIDGNAETVAWAWPRPDGGRSFGFSGLHFHENWKQDAYRALVPRGVLWTMQLSAEEPAK